MDGGEDEYSAGISVSGGGGEGEEGGGEFGEIGVWLGVGRDAGRAGGGGGEYGEGEEEVGGLVGRMRVKMEIKSNASKLGEI